MVQLSDGCNGFGHRLRPAAADAGRGRQRPDRDRADQRRRDVLGGGIAGRSRAKTCPQASKSPPVSFLRARQRYACGPRSAVRRLPSGSVNWCTPTTWPASTSAPTNEERYDVHRLSALGRPQGHPQRRHVVYTVECAHHVAKKVAEGFDDVHVIGFGGCYPNTYGAMMLERLTTHPNVGACSSCRWAARASTATSCRSRSPPPGGPCDLVIQQNGGTRSTVAAGRAWVADALAQIAEVELVPMELSDLIVGTICGGSDSTSGSPPTPRSAWPSTGWSRSVPPRSSRRPVSCSASSTRWARVPSPRTSATSWSTRCRRRRPTTPCSGTAALPQATPKAG